MRFGLAVLAAAALDLVVLLRVSDWVGVAALLAIAYLLVGSAGAGFFAGRRTALAGALAVLCGAALSGVAQYAARPDPSTDVLALLGFELQHLVAFVPYALGGAAAGAAGGALRRRAGALAR